MKIFIPVDWALSTAHDDTGMDIIAGTFPEARSPANTKSPNELEPGSVAPVSGAYQLMGSRGGKGDVVVISKGERLPAAKRPGCSYRRVRGQ
jgi:hypothetical protein